MCCICLVFEKMNLRVIIFAKTYNKRRKRNEKEIFSRALLLEMPVSITGCAGKDVTEDSNKPVGEGITKNYKTK